MQNSQFELKFAYENLPNYCKCDRTLWICILPYKAHRVQRQAFSNAKGNEKHVQIIVKQLSHK